MHQVKIPAVCHPTVQDWNGSKYLGIDLEWNYDTTVGISNNGYVVASMNNYTKKVLQEFQHPNPKKPVYGPSKYDQLEFGKKVQYAKNTNTNPINEKLKSRIQTVAGKFLYSGQAIDNTTDNAYTK